MTTGDDPRFWEAAEPLLARAGVTRSTMMGLPCLRVEGAFFACHDRNRGALVVKLPAATVDVLIAAGTGEPFAPAGRRFKEWVAIPPHHQPWWPALLDEALAYVCELQPPARKRG